MRMIRRFIAASAAVGIAAMALACPAAAQDPRDAGSDVNDLLAIQLYLVGGGFVPFTTSSNVTGIDVSAGTNTSLPGGTSSATPLVGARIHVPMWWYMRDEQHLGASFFFETGLQSGLSNQSLLQAFQGTSATAMDFGSQVVREYWQVPVLLGVTVPVLGGSSAPRALLDLYGGLTIDSWGQVLQGAESGAPGQQGFYSENRRLTLDPTVGIGLRMPMGHLDEDLPIFVGMNAELQFRPGSVVQAASQNFPVNYIGTVDPHPDLVIMARIGIAFGGR